MDLRELYIFTKLASNLNFTKTANEVAISPSALSRLITRIEAELETTLFIRDKKSVVLTPEGKLFLNFAQQTTINYTNLKSEISNWCKPINGKLKLYCSVTASLFILPQLINKYRELYPNIELKIETGDAAKGILKATNKEADIAIAALPTNIDSNLYTLKLTTIPLIFVAPTITPNNWFDTNGNLKWQDVPYIVSEQGELRREMNYWFKKNNISNPHIYAEVAGNEAILAMVALGLGIALIPKAVLDQSQLKENLTIIPHKSDLTPFSVGICIHKTLLEQVPTKLFLDMINEEIKK